MLKAKIPTTEAAILAGLQQYGPTPGGKKLLDAERAAAIWAIESGLYAVYRSVPTGRECTRIGPATKCFCGHTCTEHDLRSPMVKCQKCPCKAFAYVPIRPEEIGEWWLPRRKEFDIRTWFPKCRCNHGPGSHLPDGSRRCVECKCGAFNSNFLCLNCDRHWEEHESVFETEQERKRAGRLVGQAFMPLHDQPEMAEIVFGGPGGTAKLPEDDPKAEYQKLLKRSRSPAATRPLVTTGIERLSLAAGEEGPGPLAVTPLTVTPASAGPSRRASVRQTPESGRRSSLTPDSGRRPSLSATRSASPPAEAARRSSIARGASPEPARRSSAAVQVPSESRRASVRSPAAGDPSPPSRRPSQAAGASPFTSSPYTPTPIVRTSGGALLSSPREEEEEEQHAPRFAFETATPQAGPSRRVSTASAAPSRAGGALTTGQLHAAAAAAAASRAAFPAASRAGSVAVPAASRSASLAPVVGPAPPSRSASIAPVTGPAPPSRKASIKLDAYCSGCGGMFTPSAKFCSQCGARRAFT